MCWRPWAWRPPRNPQNVRFLQRRLASACGRAPAAGSRAGRAGARPCAPSSALGVGARGPRPSGCALLDERKFRSFLPVSFRSSPKTKAPPDSWPRQSRRSGRGVQVGGRGASPFGGLGVGSGGRRRGAAPEETGRRGSHSGGLRSWAGRGRPADRRARRVVAPGRAAGWGWPWRPGFRRGHPLVLLFLGGA